MHIAPCWSSPLALGIDTACNLRDYVRLKPEIAYPRIEELVDAGTLIAVTVEGWRQPAYLHADARIPRPITGQALLAPFDPVIWERLAHRAVVRLALPDRNLRSGRAPGARLSRSAPSL